MAQRLEQDPEYTGAFMRLFGSARPYVSQRSCQSQFYSDLITPLFFLGHFGHALKNHTI